MILIDVGKQVTNSYLRLAKKNMAPTRVRVPQETVLAPNKPQTIYPTNHTNLRAQSLEISLEKWSPTNPTTSKLSLKHTEAHRSAPSLQ